MTTHNAQHDVNAQLSALTPHPVTATPLSSSATAPATVENPTDAPEAPPHPWIYQLIRGKAAMNERVSSGAALPFRVAEFWAEASWPLHTIDADFALAEPCGDFLARLAKQGLTPAMNVIMHHKSAHVVGAVFGAQAYTTSLNYGKVEALIQQRAAMIKEGQEIPAPKGDYDKHLSKAQKLLKDSSYGAAVDLDDPKPEGPRPEDKFALLNYLEQRKFPVPDAKIEPEAWEVAGASARALCEKFGLRAVNVPLAFNAAQASDFVGRLDSTLSQLAEFLGAPPSILGLGQWLGLRAGAPGERSADEANVPENTASLAEKEKEQSKKNKSDSEYGMFMGGFIQIEVNPNFEPVVLAHEWIHSLDLWFGSREIVAKKPWLGWSVFASGIAFTDYEHSPLLRKWRDQLTEGGETKMEYLPELPQHSFLSQMRFDTEVHPEGEFHLSMGKLLAARLLKAFEGIPMNPERQATTAEQAEHLGGMITEAARLHALDHRNSEQTDKSLARRRKEFYVEWADLASMWARRQAGEAEPKTLDDMEARMRAQVLNCLAGAWCWTHLEQNFPKPDVHTQQAIRMDVLSGRLSPYFSTPHEMLAYKIEELFLARGRTPSPDDKVGSILLSWLKEEAVPALTEARDVSFASLMGVKTKSPAP